jgi:hypothetical protein
MVPASYQSPKTAVRQSPIGGRGFFAAPLTEVEIVGVKGGHLLDEAGLARHRRGERERMHALPGAASDPAARFGSGTSYPAQAVGQVS